MSAPRRRVVAAGAGRGGFARAPRRRLEWADYRNTLTTLAAGASSNVDMLSGFRAASAGPVAGCTVLRVVGQVQVFPLTTGLTADLDAHYGWLHETLSWTGIIATTGMNPYEQWMVWERAYVPFATAGGGYAVPPYERHFDQRAKRKLDEIQSTLWFCLVNDGGTSLRWTAHLRMLLAQP